MWAARRDQHVINRVRQPVEESLQRSRIVSVERSGALRADVECSSREPIGVAACEDDVGAFGAGAPGGFESDAGAATDDNDGLIEQLRRVASPYAGGFGGHDSS